MSALRSIPESNWGPNRPLGVRGESNPCRSDSQSDWMTSNPLTQSAGRDLNSHCILRHGFTDRLLQPFAYLPKIVGREGFEPPCSSVQGRRDKPDSSTARKIWLPPKDSNLHSSESKSDVLPVTPEGNCLVPGGRIELPLTDRKSAVLPLDEPGMRRGRESNPPEWFCRPFFVLYPVIARREGIEPPTRGFGDRCSANELPTPLRFEKGSNLRPSP